MLQFLYTVWRAVAYDKPADRGLNNWLKLAGCVWVGVLMLVLWPVAVWLTATTAGVTMPAWPLTADIVSMLDMWHSAATSTGFLSLTIITVKSALASMQDGDTESYTTLMAWLRDDLGLRPRGDN